MSRLHLSYKSLAGVKEDKESDGHGLCLVGHYTMPAKKHDTWLEGS